MAKESFLVVSLKEGKTKKLAQVISNDTSLKILDYLANKEGATETELATELDVPISTVHYNLQALMDTRMVKWNEFHYSEKGKEVRHYTLANKYILIAPAKDTGLKERLKSLLPVTVVLAAATALIQFFNANYGFVRQAVPEAMDISAKSAVMAVPPEAAPLAAGAGQAAPTQFSVIMGSLTTSLAFWFALGAFAALALYLAAAWLGDRSAK